MPASGTGFRLKNRASPASAQGMTDFTPVLQPDIGQPARTIRIVAKAELDGWFAQLPERERAAVAAAQFKGKPGDFVVLHGDKADDWSVAIGAPEHDGVWHLASAAARLPEGTYRLAEGHPGDAALGWLLAHHRFVRYLDKPELVPQRVLLTAEPASIEDLVRQARATALVRDMVNTPAIDMGPADIQHEAERVAKAHHAKCHTTKGHDLETGYPLIHAVGMAADKHRAPRLIEIEWGNAKHPRVAIIGKGVSFDTGGLDIKPSSGMRLMKKDMGGAAHALALADLIMGARLPVHLHLLIPAVENAIAGNAIRPGDIVRSRKGLSVEIDNTDAEGRLILADAIARAVEDKPGLIIDFATLTGAARVALGPDLPAMFCNDHALAHQLNEVSVRVHDPVWRLPLWTRYDDMFKSEVADFANSGEGGMAGAIVGALFLRKFLPAETPWVHLDTFAWRPAGGAGRPKGGEALGLRAVYALLKERYATA